MTEAISEFLSSEEWQKTSTGPLYIKLRKSLEQAILSGRLNHGQALPPERDLAEFANISRVTVRKAVDDLVKDGLLARKHGSGTFVIKPVSRLQQPLSRLTSFTEDMAHRGYVTRSEWLRRGLFHASPDEMMMLGLKTGMMVARLERLRIANELPLAIENASLASDILPDPKLVATSLYAELRRNGHTPVRAVQRISSRNVTREEASLLAVPEGSAGLAIERISYLESGRVVELTRSLYRGDAYDFVAEMTLTDA
ncbi:GntR family transcriptional regulator [Agrobacterium larrymoorei]|uniref:GntR family transcriptional regulator n=1 Tax=Agrobacterium larrymoorei TaxID=160699 RepID=UPI001571A3AC|nr:GntR family transcriptional regulator [Agrobacterium larrymoorei]NTJ44324.1 GntR family transcriptional regulator [Agrobacterium larrymoorei]